MKKRTKNLLIVAGPTASGKSSLALALAERISGVIINADAMQCYRDLRVLTARPTTLDETRAPHRLYGVRDATETATAAWWRAAALAAIAAAEGPPILCGGTFMYLHALLHGLADIPDPGAEARQQARTMLLDLGPAGLHARLSAADPATAARLRPTDSQRLARAWEVWAGTGIGLAEWQHRGATPAPVRSFAITLDPPRDQLRAAIARRWHAMIDAGAIEEVATLRARGLPPETPLLRAHGVPELSALLDGTTTLTAASERAIAAISRYTRRQTTWLRHHTLAEPPYTFTIQSSLADEKKLNDPIMAGMLNFLSGSVDPAPPAG